MNVCLTYAFAARAYLMPVEEEEAVGLTGTAVMHGCESPCE